MEYNNKDIHYRDDDRFDIRITSFSDIHSDSRGREKGSAESPTNKVSSSIKMWKNILTESRVPKRLSAKPIKRSAKLEY